MHFLPVDTFVANWIGSFVTNVSVSGRKEDCGVKKISDLKDENILPLSRPLNYLVHLRGECRLWVRDWQIKTDAKAAPVLI